MRNRWILIGYLALFFGVVSFYDSFKDNTLLVIVAAAIILIAGALRAGLAPYSTRDDVDRLVAGLKEIIG